MQKQVSIQVKPQDSEDSVALTKIIAESIGEKPENITGFQKIKQSIDARSSRQIWINLTLLVFVNDPFQYNAPRTIHFKDVTKAKHKVIIVGAGPCGLFAALQLLELGIQPIILERGKDVRARRRDLAALNKTGVVNSESNYCFGEGGAGTYSDGKLYTRSNKRGDIHRILHLFVQFGAEEKIIYEAHPHIGTNKLPQIMTAMRETIIGMGGIFLFEQKVTDLLIENNTILGVKTNSENNFYADAVILATGHSARDIFKLLHAQKIKIEAKPFALGVRIEHQQTLIDSVQYHLPHTKDIVRDSYLPPASYSLVEQVNGRGVFSFCMCPGGIIAPAATNANELVVNGWSPSKRNNPYSNSGMVVSVEEADAVKYFKNLKNIPECLESIPITSIKEQPNTALLLMYFQEAIERLSFTAGGGGFAAPAQRMIDFCEGKTSTSLPDCSYLPGLNTSNLSDVLPPFILQTLQKGFQQFGKKMRGFYTNEAVVVATESRTSSPVKIPRDATNLQHPEIRNLYPCGEGAGYAGGIVSAAMDGERVAKKIAEMLFAI